MPKEPHLSPHDNRWGRSIEWFDFDAMEVHGWMRPPPEVGDVFDAEMQSGNIARFKFTEVRRTYNPPDMFFGKVDLVTMFRPVVPSLQDSEV